MESLSINPPPQLSLKERFDIIRSIGEECIQEDELERLLANKIQPICYDGFEPSGRMHILSSCYFADGIMLNWAFRKFAYCGHAIQFCLFFFIKDACCSGCLNSFSLMSGEIGIPVIMNDAQLGISGFVDFDPASGFN